MVKIVPDEIIKEKDKVLVIDTNIGLDHALGIAKGGYETYFAVVHGQAFPKIESEINGYGFSEIKKIWDWAEALEKGVKVIVFTDSGFGYLADWLRDKGYAVFGADDKSERLELDRVYFKKVMERYDIPTPSYDIVKGIDGVVRVIKEKGMRFVKISRFRGDVETFGTDSPEDAEQILRQSKLAMFDDAITFVLEEPMNKDKFVEIGIDAFFNGKEFLSVVFDTVELKWIGNFTMVRNIEDSPWYDVLKKLESYLAKNGYRGMFAMEGFWDGDKVYVTDPTPRWPYVCSYAYSRLIENFADVVVGVSKGEDIDIKTVAKFSVQLPVYTDEAEKWKEIKSENWERTALRHSVKVKDKIWWVPVEHNVVATAIGLGNSIDDAIDDAINIVEGIDANESYHRAYEFREYFNRIRERLNELGYW